jgi:site-specific recombinase XerD
LLQLKEPIFDDLGCTYYREYIRSFFIRNYTNVDDKIFAVKHFLRRIPLDPSKLNNLTLLHVKEYERVYFLERVSREEIVKQTARVHLDQVRHFLTFLRNYGVIKFAYSVPLELFGTESRDNEFVSPDYLMKFYNTLYEIKTPDSEKYLCIFLLLLETGCRPIEICNLTYADFHETEGTLAFSCIKSDRRVLKIDPYVKEALVQYIQQHRSCLLPNEHIFLKQDGSLLLTKNITSMFKSYNYLAFDRIVFSAKTLRHTFITNALDEKNDFGIVSKSVGHRDWRSTMHYFHRNLKRLLKNTLPYNPNVRSE